MSITYLNPFSKISTQYSNGLEYLINNLPATPSFDDLNNTTIAYIQTLLDPTTIPPDSLNLPMNDALASVIPNSVNDYNNQIIPQNLMMSAGQAEFVASVLQGIRQNSIESLGAFFDEVDNEISQSNMLTINKTSLYMASGIARASYTYWMGVLSTSGHEGWTDHLSGSEAINYSNVQIWVSASFLAALSGYAQGQTLAVGGAEVLNVAGRTIGIPLALGAALGVTAGKVIFKWVQKPSIGAGSDLIKSISRNLVNRSSARECGYVWGPGAMARTCHYPGGVASIGRECGYVWGPGAMARECGYVWGPGAKAKAAVRECGYVWGPGAKI